MPEPELSVAIIGAGLGGIAAAVNLKRAGIENFTIFEMSAGPGGTWWDNTYPGAECDIDIVFYAYSFMPGDFPRTHASQKEIQAYIQMVIDTYELGRHLRFGTRITEAVWDDQSHTYTLQKADGGSVTVNILVSALGLLNVPRYPSWPGLDRFQGPKFHTARWEHQHDLAGKRVAVVGIGSSAAQVVPAIAPIAGEVMMFAREPAYVMPKDNRLLTGEERARFGTRWGRQRARLKMFINVERNMSVRNPRSTRQRNTREAFLRYRDRSFAGRPDLSAALTPNYPFACKRPVGSSELFPALTRDNVRLVPREVVGVSEHGVIDHLGDEHAADVLVMATGFQPWNYQATLQVRGRANRSLRGVWGDEPEAFLGIQVAGFPNFFMLYGPNTNYMCVTFMLERQAEYVVRQIRRLIRGRNTSIDVDRGIQDFYNRRVDRALSKKTLEGACHNYYHTATGRNVVTWPWRGSVYIVLTRLAGLACRVRRLADEPSRGHLPRERRLDQPQSAEPPKHVASGGIKIEEPIC